MKKLAALIGVLSVALLAPAWAAAENGDDTRLVTVYLVRHTEADTRDQTDRDPRLAAEGVERAEHLAGVLSSVEIDAAFSTPLNRTRSTAQPVIDGRGLELQSYMPGEIKTLASRIARGEFGGTVFVAGHSNTTPGFVTALGGPELANLNHDEYDNLFIVTIAVTGGEPGAVSTQRLHY